ncbi:hypothetical protein [Piscinibacter sakaiensis]|uniref:hypothetical protein n=1 Tax=Piscinibacter sakaiensis TaxID=1547922 RepID=UPI003AAA8B5C
MKNDFLGAEVRRFLAEDEERRWPAESSTEWHPTMRLFHQGPDWRDNASAFA